MFKAKFHFRNNRFYLGTCLQVTLKIFSGAVPSYASSMLLQPLDTIKTRQQLFRSSFISTIERIYAIDGVIGFWRGLGPSMWRVIPSSFVYFYTLDYMTNNVIEKKSIDRNDLPAKDAFIISSFSRGLSCTLFIPFIVIKTKFEAFGNQRPYIATIDAFKKIYRESGLRGLYTGSIPTLLRDVPQAGLYFIFYQRMEKFLYEYTSLSKNSRIAPAALIAAFFSTVITHPFDALKTNMQCNMIGQYPKLIPSLSYCWKKNLLLAGIWTRVLRRTLSMAFAWLVYERIVEIGG